LKLSRPCEPPGTSFCLTLPVSPVPRRKCGNGVTGTRRLPLSPLVFGTSSKMSSSRWTKTPAALRGLRSTVRVWGSRIHRSDSRSGSRVLLLREARTSPNETPSRPPMTRAMANCGPPPWRKLQTETSPQTANFGSPPETPGTTALLITPTERQHHLQIHLPFSDLSSSSALRQKRHINIVSPRFCFHQLWVIP
jgi:hypothetical protein